MVEWNSKVGDSDGCSLTSRCHSSPFQSSIFLPAEPSRKPYSHAPSRLPPPPPPHCPISRVHLPQTDEHRPICASLILFIPPTWQCVSNQRDPNHPAPHPRPLQQTPSLRPSRPFSCSSFPSTPPCINTGPPSPSPSLSPSPSSSIPYPHPPPSTPNPTAQDLPTSTALITNPAPPFAPLRSFSPRPLPDESMRRGQG